MESGLEARVEREKVSNESEDIIARSAQLKARFPHVLRAPSIARMRSDEWTVLRDIAGRRVLDFGCGKGDYAVKLLGVGARVDGIDISQTYIDECYKVMESAGVQPDSYSFQVMDAHKLAFPDETFDFVVGNGILHHLDFTLALDEVRRVLKPGGRAVFQEPLGGNPLLKLFRWLTPKARTVDERPFYEADIRRLERDWRAESTYYGLVTAPLAVITSIILRPWPNNLLLNFGDQIDRHLSRTKSVRSWHQYVLFNLIKPH